MRQHFHTDTSARWGIFRLSVPLQITGSDINVHFFCLTTLSGGSEAGRGSLFTTEKKFKKRGLEGGETWLICKYLDTFIQRFQIVTRYESSQDGDGAVVTGKRHYEPCSRWCFLSRFAWLCCRLPTVSIAGSLWGWSIGFFSFASVFFNPLFFPFACYFFPTQEDSANRTPFASVS